MPKLKWNELPALPEYEWQDKNPVFITKRDLCRFIKELRVRDGVTDGAFALAIGWSIKSAQYVRSWCDVDGRNWKEPRTENVDKLIGFVNQFYPDVFSGRPVVLLEGDVKRWNPPAS